MGFVVVGAVVGAVVPVGTLTVVLFAVSRLFPFPVSSAFAVVSAGGFFRVLDVHRGRTRLVVGTLRFDVVRVRSGRCWLGCCKDLATSEGLNFGSLQIPLQTASYRKALAQRVTRSDEYFMEVRSHTKTSNGAGDPPWPVIFSFNTHMIHQGFCTKRVPHFLFKKFDRHAPPAPGKDRGTY